jgi:hypothetical protein
VKKLAKYDWKSESGRSGTATLTDTGVFGNDSVPVTVAEAIRFMFKTSTKELKADEYTVSWYLDYPRK